MSYIERIRAEGRDANPFFTLMGVELGTLGTGSAEIRMPVRPDMMNGEEWLQGGIYTALADEAMVLAIYPLLDPGERIATISETTSFLGGVQDGVLVASGTVVKRGRRVIFAEGEVVREGRGRILARCSAAYAVMKE
ncbi:MAG: PaaI family thioesterase [Methanomicrobiales archaeon]|nr:PaaI family thioesterase [Methanomicrobiales archaeon]NYT20177.1 PaaI family thioesterase [Methanomicrobiales archaeon]